MRTADQVHRFLQEARARRLSPRTIEFYTWGLAKLSRAHHDLPRDPDQLVDLLLDQDLGAESTHDLWRILRRFFTWRAQRARASNPMKHVPAPRRHRTIPATLEPEDVPRLLRSCSCRRDQALCALALDTGLRVGELATLTWPDVHGNGIRVDGKTGPRSIPISSEVLRLMIGLGDGHHLWIGRKGPLTRSGVTQAIRRALAKAGFRLSKAGPHLLRHTFGRLYVMNGGDLFSLQRILGHANIATTRIYVELDDRDVRRQHAQFSPIRNVDLTQLPHLQEIA